MFRRQREGSVICTSCGMLVGVNDERYDAKWSDDNLAEIEKGWIKKGNSPEDIAAHPDSHTGTSR